MKKEFLNNELLKKELIITELKARLEIAEKTISNLHSTNCNCGICKNNKSKIKKQN
ncbi:hypothetical protein AMYT_a0176 (plasmid) [Malaciobacter mytili LMG 24559]|uniref:hypothetical protein n=1 Tax=Malaciobacter mytili TaxID=603050 RepID=UPI000E106D74|nr:hypothetical protein [Malaciobacter mytili]AXH16474.1 hypothetical protein AMYT_a0176 [Malaciobacter mytili LMG 24559]